MILSFHAEDILIVLAAGLLGVSYFRSGRREMLRWRLASVALLGVYFLTVHGYSGALGMFIAFLGTVVQVIVPDRLLDRTLYLRAVIAVLLSIAGIAVFWGVESVWPLIGVIIARLSEIQKSPQRIRFGFILMQLCWLLYALEEEFGHYTLFMGAALLFSTSAFVRYCFKKTEDVKGD